MIKLLVLILIASFSICSCATLDEPVGKRPPRRKVATKIDKKSKKASEKKISKQEGKKSDISNMYLVYMGMTKEDVHKIMGEYLVVGYNKEQGDLSYEEIRIASPYSTKKIEKNGKVYEVEYYFTNIGKIDNCILDEELTPVVFEDGKVIGKGQKFLSYL